MVNGVVFLKLLTRFTVDHRHALCTPDSLSQLRGQGHFPVSHLGCGTPYQKISGKIHNLSLFQHQLKTQSVHTSTGPFECFTVSVQVSLTNTVILPFLLWNSIAVEHR